ncbi:HTH domain-containing protein, partial [Rhizobium ruizarguesonis]
MIFSLMRDHLFPCFCDIAVLTALWQQESSGMRKADRLFQIIQILRRTSRPVTSSELADELEVARRT